MHIILVNCYELLNKTKIFIIVVVLNLVYPLGVKSWPTIERIFVIDLYILSFLNSFVNTKCKTIHSFYKNNFIGTQGSFFLKD